MRLSSMAFSGSILATAVAASFSPVLAQENTTAQAPADVSSSSPYREWQKERAEEAEKSPTNEPAYPGRVRPEGKTLPERVMRIRVPIKSVSGSQSFDKDGNKKDAIVDFKATGIGLVAEYGINNKTSFQLLLPYYLSQKATFNEGHFRGSDIYAAAREEGIKAAAAKLVAAGAAKTPEEGIAYIKAGGKGTDGTPIIDAVNKQVDSIAIPAAKDAARREGRKGIGDLQLGLLYEVTDHTDPLYFSIGGGFRIPTGKLDVPSYELPTSRGVYEIGVRTDLDYDIIKGLMISWENQVEVGVSKSKKKNDIGEKKNFERRGVRNVGFVHLKHGLGIYTNALDGLELRVGADYDADSAERLDGKEISPRSFYLQQYYSIGYSMLPLKVPFEIDYEFYAPWQGKNVALATTTHLVTLRTFYVF